MPSDPFKDLLPARWRDVAFPVSSVETSLKQDLATHAYPDRDGAHIESTGRAPIHHTFRIPFFNDIGKGPSEYWKMPLFPVAWRDFMVACADRSTGVLQHPILGEMKCKVESVNTSLVGSARGGVDVTATFIEHTEKPEDLENLLTAGSPISDMELAAIDVDLKLASLDGLGLPEYPESFEESMRKLKAIPDKITAGIASVTSPINRIIYRANSISKAALAIHDVTLHPLLASLERLKGSAHDLKKESIQKKQRATKNYTVPSDTTFAAAAAQIGAKLGELMGLNGQFLGASTIPRGSVLRYYA
jgi:prophage DNA circulation protein